MKYINKIYKCDNNKQNDTIQKQEINGEVK